MTSTSAGQGSPIKRPQPVRPLPSDHQIILDWLCRQPAKVHDFADIADAIGMKRGVVEACLMDLRHQRYGCILQSMGPGGLRLRARHAFLPADSPHRAGYPPVAPVAPDEPIHSTLQAVQRAQADEAARQEREEAIRRETALSRAVAHGAYRKRKIEAREKAAEGKRTDPKERFRTGYAQDTPAAPLAPTVLAEPTPVAPKVEIAAASATPHEADDAPAAVYKKKEMKK